MLSLGYTLILTLTLSHSLTFCTVTLDCRTLFTSSAVTVNTSPSISLSTLTLSPSLSFYSLTHSLTQSLTHSHIHITYISSYWSAQLFFYISTLISSSILSTISLPHQTCYNYSFPHPPPPPKQPSTSILSNTLHYHSSHPLINIHSTALSFIVAIYVAFNSSPPALIRAPRSRKISVIVSKRRKSIIRSILGPHLSSLLLPSVPF